MSLGRSALAHFSCVGASMVACSPAQQAKTDQVLSSKPGQLFCRIQLAGGGAVLAGAVDAAATAAAPGASRLSSWRPVRQRHLSTPPVQRWHSRRRVPSQVRQYRRRHRPSRCSKLRSRRHRTRSRHQFQRRRQRTPMTAAKLCLQLQTSFGPHVSVSALWKKID